MQAVADFRIFCHDVDKFGRKILGMRSHKPYAELALNLSNFFEKLRKSEVSLIGVYILPKQGYLLISFPY